MSGMRRQHSAGDATDELVRLREAIDRVDEVLVRLLDRRPNDAVAVGEIKTRLSVPISVPARGGGVAAREERWGAAHGTEAPGPPRAARRAAIVPRDRIGPAFESSMIALPRAVEQECLRRRGEKLGAGERLEEAEEVAE